MTHKLTPHTALNAVVVMILTSLAGLAGCKSAADKCRDENNQIYAKKMSECKDDACKKQAAQELKDYLNACDSMK